MFSRSCSRVEAPVSTVVTPSTPCRKRQAHRAAVSSGRRARSFSMSGCASTASRPPRRGSITHTGRPHSRSSAILAAPSWNSQSSQLSWIWQNSMCSP